MLQSNALLRALLRVIVMVWSMLGHFKDLYIHIHRHTLYSNFHLEADQQTPQAQNSSSYSPIKAAK